MVGEVTASGDTPFARLRFASLAHLPLGATKQEGIAEIIYYVRSTRDGKYTLRRSDKLILYGPAEEKETDPILCENLKALTFRYYGTEGEEGLRVKKMTPGIRNPKIWATQPHGQSG
jgi:general secretion pathway protein J